MNQIEKLKEEIADIESYGDLADADDQNRLRSLKRSLNEAELDAENQSKPLTIERLGRFESEQRCLHRLLDVFGKEVAKERGKPIPEHAYLDSYERWDERGTRVIQISYRIPARYEPDYTSITFPESYLDEDSNWREIERDKLAAENAEKEAKAAQQKADTEARERAQLARLQAKYGDKA